MIPRSPKNEEFAIVYSLFRKHRRREADGDESEHIDPPTQKLLYQRIFGVLTNLRNAVPHNPGDDDYREAVREIGRFQETVENAIVHAPVTDEKSVQDFELNIATRAPQYVALAATVVAAICVEARGLIQPNTNSESRFWRRVSVLMTIYAGSKAADIALLPDLETFRSRAESIQNSTAESAVFLKNIQKQANEVAASVVSLPNEVNSQIQLAKSRVANLQAEVQADLEGYKEGLRKEMGLDRVRRLWLYRARWAAGAFWASALVLGVLIIGPAALIWFNREELRRWLFEFFRPPVGATTIPASPPIADPTIIQNAFEALPYLVLISLPIFLLIWLIRLVVRFNMRSMILQDDARQRHTILNTYLHLVEKGPADRPEALAIVLEALFRRTPGHGPETIEPPNLTDIIKIGNPTGAPK